MNLTRPLKASVLITAIPNASSFSKPPALRRRLSSTKSPLPKQTNGPLHKILMTPHQHVPKPKSLQKENALPTYSGETNSTDARLFTANPDHKISSVPPKQQMIRRYPLRQKICKVGSALSNTLIIIPHIILLGILIRKINQHRFFK